MKLSILMTTSFSLSTGVVDADHLRSSQKSAAALTEATHAALPTPPSVDAELFHEKELGGDEHNNRLLSTASECPSVSSWQYNTNAACTCSPPDLKRVWFDTYYYCANDVVGYCKSDFWCKVDSRCEGDQEPRACVGTEADGADCVSHNDCSQDSFCDAVSKVCTSKDVCPILPKHGSYMCQQDSSCVCGDSAMVQGSVDVANESGEHLYTCYYCSDPDKADGDDCAGSDECASSSYCETGITYKCKPKDVCPGPPISNVKFICLNNPSCSCNGGLVQVTGESTNADGEKTPCYYCSSSSGPDDRGGSTTKDCPAIKPGTFTCETDPGCVCKGGTPIQSSKPSSSDPTKTCHVCSAKADGQGCQDRYDCGANSYCRNVGGSKTCQALPNTTDGSDAAANECLDGLPASGTWFTCKDASCECKTGKKKSFTSSKGNTCYYCE